MTAPTEQSALRAEAGFGMVEVVISILLFGLISMAFLPMLIQAMTTSVNNITTTTATQLVSDQLEQARDVESTCTALQGFADETPVMITDSRGVDLQPTRSLGECPDDFPGTLSFTVTVQRSNDDGIDSEVARATTLLAVTGP